MENVLRPQEQVMWPVAGSLFCSVRHYRDQPVCLFSRLQLLFCVKQSIFLECFFTMPRDRGHSATSPSGRSRSGPRHENQESTRENELMPQETEDPPSWAKQQLQQQKDYSKELRRSKNELDAAKRVQRSETSHVKPEFRFERNKKQDRLNQNVLERSARPWISATRRKEIMCSVKVRLCLQSVIKMLAARISKAGTQWNATQRSRLQATPTTENESRKP